MRTGGKIRWELTSRMLPWVSPHGRINDDHPVKICIFQLCADSTQLWAKRDTDGWQGSKRFKGFFVVSTTIYIYIYIYIWPSGRVSSSHTVVAGSIFSGGDHGIPLPMRPNKVETAVQCSVCRMWVFAGFSSHSDNIIIYEIPLLDLYIYFLCG